jgi:hypothetical protein
MTSTQPHLPSINLKTRNENGERRLLICQFASCILIIFANIAMTRGVKQNVTPDSAWLLGSGVVIRWIVESDKYQRNITKNKPRFYVQRIGNPPAISREISQASASTVRAHFGCIFKATADCAT